MLDRPRESSVHLRSWPRGGVMFGPINCTNSSPRDLATPAGTTLSTGTDDVAFANFPLCTDTSCTHGPDLDPIRLIHRGEDSYVRFSRVEAGEMHIVGSLSVGDLDAMFPTIREELTADAYFTLNGFFRSGTAKTEDLRYLNACYSDLDFYKSGSTRSEALRCVEKAQAAGEIPPVSLLADSGRGLWLFWLLESPSERGRPERYQRHHLEVGMRYRRVQTALLGALQALEADLEPDPRAIDASRIAPVPGTRKSKANRQVTYWTVHDSVGQSITYSIKDLEHFFGLSEWSAEEKPNFEPASWKSEKKNPNMRAGYTALHAARIVDLEALWALRGGFREGHRNTAALVYACHLRGYGYSETKVTELLRRLAAECQPRLSIAETDRAIRFSGKLYRWSDATLVSRLEITPQELRSMESIDPDRPPRKTAGPKRADKREERRAAILEVVAQRGGDLPSGRRMESLLAERGIGISYKTILKDYYALGLRGPKTQVELPLESLQMAA